MDFIGVTRAIDQAVYMLLNALAIILWRIDSAIIGMSLYGYATQDWLTGTGGGVWYILDWLLNTSGLFGVNTWTLFAGLALMLWGLARIARPFIATSPVHPGKLLFFFVISYIVISQGSSLMQDIERWRLDAGSAIYQGVAGSGSADLSVPNIPVTSDPLAPPSDLDGQSPIRGWEAVTSSYFLATSSSDLHQPYPPEAFRVAYCLYNPDEPIELQTTENAQGCSPQKAWDEWDEGEMSFMEEVLGLDVEQAEEALESFLGVLLGDIDLNLTVPVPTIIHHPENRELGIRQAQAGVARLALGVIVALFPIIEANISLMLALAASFVYLTLPIVLLFGFFLATEPMVNRLLMQFVAIIIRTLIINGIVALFMLLLMNTALGGSLTAYLGLVGVGLVGGLFLARIAAATMKETLTQAIGALGSVWMGTSTGLLGQAAARPARATLGLAKMSAAAALLGAGGAMRFLDLAGTGYEGFRAGATDLRRGAPDTMQVVDRQAARLPAPLNKLAQESLGTQVWPETTNGDEKNAHSDSSTAPLVTGLAAPLAAGLLALPAPSETEAGDEAGAGRSSGPANDDQRTRWGDAPTISAAMPPTAAPHRFPERKVEVGQWVSQLRQAQKSQRGLKQASDKGHDLVGEELAWKVERAVGRHQPGETQAVLDAAQQVAQEFDHAELVREGRLTPQAITAVRAKLDPDTARAFSGQSGAWDLAALTAMALQRQTIASPGKFRRAMARAKSGWGQDSPGHKVPRALGLDPVAAGPHYTTMNRFTRLSEAAGLSASQRERLLAEAQGGQVSAEMQTEIAALLQRQREKGYGLAVTREDIIASAKAMPGTLSGPEQVWTTPRPSQPLAGQPDEQTTKQANPVSQVAPPEGKPGQAETRPGQTARQLKEQPSQRRQPEQAKAQTGPVPPPETKDRVPSGQPARVSAVDIGALLGQTGRPAPTSETMTGQTNFGQALQASLQDQPPDRPETRAEASGQKPEQAETSAAHSDGVSATTSQTPEQKPKRSPEEE